MTKAGAVLAAGWTMAAVLALPTTARAEVAAIRKTVVVRAPAKEVWETWTTTKGVQTFFAANARVDGRVGGSFEIYFNAKAAPGEQGSEGCRIITFEPQKTLSFTWNAPPSFPNMRKQHTLVVVKLREADPKSTEVTLEHVGWGDGAEWEKVRAYFDRAWEAVLGSLKQRFDHGPIGWPASDTPARQARFCYVITPSREELVTKPTPDEGQAIAAHFAYLKQATADGKVILAGPCMAPPYLGIVVFDAKNAGEAKAFMEGDPAVKAGVFKANVYPFSLSLFRGY